ncbi:tRNA-5-carboxymethylaminomethyl-2-thiouridine(34)synthesis protein MnmE, partial [hydrothermal vent metagenome]
EAVLDIISSKTDAFLKVSTNQLKGDLSIALDKIREALLKSFIELEAIVNFPEDDIDQSGINRLNEAVLEAQHKIKSLLESSDHGRILKEGIKIVLCGKPNVGKSSLLNCLLRTPRAIVSDIAGTTRDTIEETAQIGGIPFQLIDTAGMLNPRDLVEQEAVKRSHLSIQQADLILFVVDGSSSLDEEDKLLAKTLGGQNVLLIVNKDDLSNKVTEEDLKKILDVERIVSVSALKKKGLDQLEKSIVECIWHSTSIDTHEIIVSNARHIQALTNCLGQVESAQEKIGEGLSLEFVSEEIKRAINFLDSITGKNIDTDLLDQIFSSFCIGK